VSDEKFIGALLEKHRGYQGNQESGVAPLYALPTWKEMFGGKENADTQGYNSNSYAHGLIEAAGGAAVHPSVKTPLYNNAIPKDFYQPQPLP
jgi:hypothetical protein